MGRASGRAGSARWGGRGKVPCGPAGVPGAAVDPPLSPWVARLRGNDGPAPYARGAGLKGPCGPAGVPGAAVDPLVPARAAMWPESRPGATRRPP